MYTQHMHKFIMSRLKSFEKEKFSQGAYGAERGEKKMLIDGSFAPAFSTQTIRECLQIEYQTLIFYRVVTTSL